METFNSKINAIFLPLKKKQIFTFILLLILTVIRFALVIFVQKTIDSVSSSNINTTYYYIAIDMGLVCVFFAVNCVYQYVFRDLEYTSHYHILDFLYDSVLKKKIEFFGENPKSVLLAKIKDDSKYISDWKSIGSIVILGQVITVAVTVAILLKYSVIISLVVIVVASLCFFVLNIISKKISDKTYDLQVLLGNSNKQILDALNGIKEIKQLKKETYFSSKLHNVLFNQIYKTSKQISIYRAVFVSMYVILTMLLPVIATLVGVILLANNNFTVGNLVAVFSLAGTLQEPILTIPEYMSKRKQALIMQNRIVDIVEDDTENYKIEQIDKLSDFTFDSEHFSYDDSNRFLNNVNFNLSPENNKILLKGASGSGKTTIINIISKFINVKSSPVTVKYNLLNIKDISPASYYEHVLQAQQIPYIFEGSILENITLGDDYNKKDVDEIIEVTCLTDLVAEKGLDYILKEHDSNISGGQKQRIGIARMLIKKPDLLILDEPTSALNKEIAEKLLLSLDQYCDKHGMYLIVISHDSCVENNLKNIEVVYL